MRSPHLNKSIQILKLWGRKWNAHRQTDGSPSGSAVRNHCRTHPAPCVRPCCVCSVLRADAQFCRFDKADATADVQWHCNHRPSLWYHYFPAQELTGCGYPGLLDRINRSAMCPRWESNPRLPACKASPYPLGQALRVLSSIQTVEWYMLLWYTCTRMLLYIKPYTVATNRWFLSESRWRTHYR